MCMVYYLGSDGDVPLTLPWTKDAPAFHVTLIDGPESGHVKEKLPHRRLVYLGSHEGCGCGFRSYRDGYLMKGDAEEKDVVADHAALAAYLSALPPSQSPIQIFGCWSGDESDPVEHFRDISPADVLDPQFGFREREVLTLKK
jgi:hypothetical protein